MKGVTRIAIGVGVLVALALAGYALTVNNTALLHHTPDPFRDGVLDNSMLHSDLLWPKIFGTEFLLATYSHYRPLGYALFALTNGVMPLDVVRPWHLVLLGVHLVSAIVIFVSLRMLVRDGVALGMAGAFLLHPAMAPLVNDVNMIWFLLGILFTCLTVWLFLVHLRKSSLICLGLSVITFIASLFTYEHAVVAPAFLIALCLLHKQYPRGAAATVIYLVLAALGAGLFQLSPLLTLAILCLVALAVGGAASVGKDRYLALAKTLPAYVAGIVAFFIVAAQVQPIPLTTELMDLLRQSGLTEPFAPSYVQRAMLTGSALNVIALGVAALLPVAAVLGQRAAAVAMVVAVSFLLVATTQVNRNYRDDVTYWQWLDQSSAGAPAVQLNLAVAHVAQGQFAQARGQRTQARDEFAKALDILQYLKWEVIPSPLWKDKPHLVFHAMVNSKLGVAHAGLGDDKLAGYYLFHFGGPYKGSWHLKAAKHCLTDSAEFALAKGYLSAADSYWAGALVVDRYDVRLYNNLGRMLIYKNFFRAAAKHFHHVLRFQPDNVDALYYSAFVAQLLGDDREYDRFVARWREVTGSSEQIDFTRIRDRYNFDRETMRAWFSGDPVTFSAEMETFAAGFGNPYSLTYQGQTCVFAEVPLEIGSYFVRKKNDRRALRFLRLAYKINPNSVDAVRELAQIYRRLNQVDQALRYERLLEMMNNAKQTQ